MLHAFLSSTNVILVIRSRGSDRKKTPIARSVMTLATHNGIKARPEQLIFSA